MNLDTVQPPDNLIAELQGLQQTIANDHAGDRTRELCAYMRNSEQACAEMQVRTPADQFEQRRLAQLLGDAFAAGGEIVRAAWQKAHGAELAV